VSAVKAEKHEHEHGDHAAHGHDHAHPHDHAAPAAQGAAPFTAQEAQQARRLKMVLALVSGFFVVELAGAIWAQSVVLQADAAHLLMDVLALGVSLFAMRLAVRRPTARFTYGLRRAEPVAAIFSALLVLATTVGIVAEGVGALQGGTPPRASIMLVVAVMAIAVNGLSAWLLHGAIGHGHAHDPDNPDDKETEGEHAHDHGHHHHHAHGGKGHALNLRGAWLHLMGDTLGGLAALVAAIVIRVGGSATADPIASFVVAAILLFGSLRLLKDALLVLLEAAPPHLPVATIRQVIVAYPGVVAVHDLHVWTLGAGHDAITAHVRADTVEPTFGQHLSEHVRSRLGVEYVTVQVEVGDGHCRAPASAWEPGERSGG
jgi:cobalt-zinc-cadmium efflux system protein